jgi:hypothetical protein
VEGHTRTGPRISNLLPMPNGSRVWPRRPRHSADRAAWWPDAAADEIVQFAVDRPAGQARRTVAREGQLPGGKNTSDRTSMLSRGGAPDANGLSKAVWKESLARPSVALSCTLISTTSSGCISEK